MYLEIYRMFLFSRERLEIIDDLINYLFIKTTKNNSKMSAAIKFKLANITIIAINITIL